MKYEKRDYTAPVSYMIMARVQSPGKHLTADQYYELSRKAQRILDDEYINAMLGDYDPKEDYLQSMMTHHPGAKYM